MIHTHHKKFKQNREKYNKSSKYYLKSSFSTSLCINTIAHIHT